MFGIDSAELLLVVLVAVVVIGPKDLPRVMRTVGQWVARARGMANQFRMGVDQMVRDTEIADLEKKWREQNEAIMRAHPAAVDAPDFADMAPPPEPEPEPIGWSLDKKGDERPAPALMRPLHRPAPMPPVHSQPERPTPPKLGKAVASAPAPALRKPEPFPLAPQRAEPPARSAPGRRAPRTTPGAGA